MNYPLFEGLMEVGDSLKIRGTDFWLDPRSRKALAFVSHAHSDHMMRRHRHVILSLNTARFYQERFPRADLTALAFSEKLALRGATLELLPAGHILGSSQLYLELDGLRIVYTGDVKLSSSFTAERVQIRPCDVLIMESTYGEPRYVFPGRDELAEDLVKFCLRCFSRKIVPVVLAYTIGKAQEAVKVLGDRGIPCVLEESVFRATEIYRELGVDLINYYAMPGPRGPYKVLIVPPWRRSAARGIVRKKTLWLSGWALDKEKVRLVGVDEALPLSDHADYPELITYVQLAKPKKVYTFHGSGTFAKLLRQQGIDAVHLEPKGPVQPTLWGYI